MESTVHKEECEIQFLKIQEDPENKKCVVCTSVAREWASVNNGVFLCLSCAAQCKDLKQSLCLIKSVNLDNWTQRQINLMKKGGNTAFLTFMDKFKLNSLNFEDRLCTKAAVYYRQKLTAQVDGMQPSPEPSYDQGRIIVITNKKDQPQNKGQEDLFDSAKQSISNAYDKTKQFTKQTFTAIGDKMKSEQFKKSMSEFGAKTKDVASAGYQKTKAGFSYLWGAISSKMSSNK